MVPSGSQRARSPASARAVSATRGSHAALTFVHSSLRGREQSNKGTCAVQAFMGHAAVCVWVGHKHLRRELWALEVAARHLHPATC